MYKKNWVSNRLVLMLSIGGVALSACSTQGASRYNDAFGAGSAHCGTVSAPSACSAQKDSRYGVSPFGSGQVPCGAVIQPCQQQPLYMIEYHAVTVTPPSYIVPVPCPVEQCAPVIEPPVVVEPPVVEAPVIVEPPIVQAPVVLPPPPLRISCPEGTIPGYGGQDCIPIAVPRK